MSGYVASAPLDPSVLALLAEMAPSGDDVGDRHSSEGGSHSAHHDHIRAVADTEHEEWVVVDCASAGSVSVRIVRPTAITDPVPAIIYVCGGDLLSGAVATHDRLVQYLVVHTGAAVICPDYGSAWQADQVHTVDRIHAVCRWVATDGADHGIDPSRIALAGDSIGATLAASAARTALQSNAVHLRYLALLCPLADPTRSGPSHQAFADGFLLADATVEKWWRHHTGGTDHALIEASLVRGRPELLTGMPPTLIITAEADPVRDDGEVLAAQLRQAGVPTTSVRYNGMVHDFVALDALAQTASVGAALRQVASALATALGCSATPGDNPVAPALTEAQWKTLTACGTRRDVSSGDLLFEAGQAGCDMIVVETGAIEVIRRATAANPETVVAHYGPRQFSGELNLLTGQATYFDGRVSTAGTVVRIDPHEFRRLMDEQPELSDVILRALVARRQNLLTQQAGTIEVLADAA